METAIVYWGYVGIIPGIMEKKMETTIVYWDSRDVISLGSQAEAILGHRAQARSWCGRCKVRNLGFKECKHLQLIHPSSSNSEIESSQKKPSEV